MPPFPDGLNHDNPHSKTPEQQSHASQHQKHGHIGRFDGIKLFKPVNCRSHINPVL